MLAILFYCLKVLLCSGLLFVYYLLALRNKQFHEWNRYYLLVAIILSFTLPFVQIPIFYAADNATTNIIFHGLSFGNYADEVVIRPNNNWQINWSNILILLYAGVSIFFLIKLIKTFNWIRKIKSFYPSEMLGEISFYNTNESGTPFSFFKNIFWHKDIEPNTSKGSQMLRHEIAHVRQLHSVDKLFLEITTIIAWWNPFFYLIKKELSTIHEFIADRQATYGDDQLQYASLLLSKAFGNNNIPITNPFFHSQLKRRIAMLTIIKNPRFSYLRRLMVLPLAACLFMLFAFRYKKIIDKQLKSPTEITVVIDAGHGGIDDGALNKNGLKEKNITLAIAQKIASLAVAKNIKIILTRNNDALPGGGNNVNEGLKQRIAIATNSRADLFISLHVNTSNTPSTGISAFISKTNNNLMGKNQLFASSVLDELEKSGLPVIKQIQQSKEQGVLVLDKNPLPSVLLELGYINNPSDAAFIADPKNQEKLANEILDAIVKAEKNLKDDNKQTAFNYQPANNKVLQSHLPDSIKINNKKDKLINKKDPKNNSKFISGDSAIEDKSKQTLNFYGNPHVNMNQAKDSAKAVLYLLDGVETSADILHTINPNKIKSISVLKGEDATKLYGEKGRNGVILIWTKKDSDTPIAINAFH